MKSVRHCVLEVTRTGTTSRSGEGQRPPAGRALTGWRRSQSCRLPKNVRWRFEYQLHQVDVAERLQSTNGLACLSSDFDDDGIAHVIGAHGFDLLVGPATGSTQVHQHGPRTPEVSVVERLVLTERVPGPSDQL